MTTPAILESQLCYHGRVFDVVEHEVRFPDGSGGRWGVVEHPGAIAIVALDAEGRWLLVRQYRLPAGGQLLEVPAGTLERDEPPEQAAHRELREEIGYAAASLVPLGGTWMAPGFCSEYIHYFLATGLTLDPLPHDHDEHLSEPIAMTYDEVLTAIDEGRICDAKSVVAAHLFARHARRTGPPPAP